MKDNRPKVGVGVIIRKNNKVLLGRRNGKLGTQTWGFVGGHLEFMESIENCVIREVLEETSLSIKNIQFVSITNDMFTDTNNHYLTIFIVCDYKKGKVINLEPDKTQEWKWFEWEKLPRPLFLPIENLLAQKYHPFKRY